MRWILMLATSCGLVLSVSCTKSVALLEHQAVMAERDRLSEEVRRLTAAQTDLTERLRELQGRISESDFVAKEVLRERLNSCEALRKREAATSAQMISQQIEHTKREVRGKFESGYHKGLSDLWSSIEIQGRPSSDSGWLWGMCCKTHQFTFAVRIRGKDTYTFTIETKNEGTAIDQSLEGLSAAASVASTFGFKPLL